MDNKAIDVIRNLALDMITNAGAGHPGEMMTAAPILYTLFTKHLNINPAVSDWINRDRLVVSSANSIEALYSTMFLSGYPLMIEDIKSYRKLNSKLPATPSINTFGVDISTGFPGEGIASACGIALAEKIHAEKYNYKRNGIFDKIKLSKLFDYYTYVLCNDEDMMAGISYEAASFAGANQLGKLIILYNSNKLTKDGDITKGFKESVLGRFSSLGFQTIVVKNGESVTEINKAISKAKQNVTMPSIILINNKLGKGLEKEGTINVFSDPISKDDLSKYKVKIGAGSIPFTLLKEPASHIRDQVVSRGNKIYDSWKLLFEEYKKILIPEQVSEINNMLTNKVNFDLSKVEFQIDFENKELLRDSNHKVINTISSNVYNFIGGSANLASSTRTYLDNKGDLLPNNLSGKNIIFSGRNEIIGSVMNGLAVSGFRPFASTHLSNLSKTLSSLKMSALMGLPVTYIYTHDSITIGSDGPVYQPINELSMLRSIPNLYVFRPADIKEVIGTWDLLLKNNITAAISLPKTEVKAQQGTNSAAVIKGAYIAGKEKGTARAIIIATGAEVQIAKSVQVKLLQEGIDIRVVSMPCMELFNMQPMAYKNELLNLGVPIFVLEFGSSFGFEKFVSGSNYLFTIDKFGISASKEDIVSSMNLDIDNIIQKIKSLL